MIALGLSSADLKLFNQSLSTHHSIKVTVQVLDLNHRYLADISADLLDGQVNIDGLADVTRSLTLQLRDPERTLQFDSRSPADGALYFDRMLRVVYSVKSELLPRWVDVPIFCGPVTKMSRSADVLNVECQGKESLVIPPTYAYFAKTYGKGWNRAYLVKTIMDAYGGETRFSLPAWGDKTPGPVTLTPETNIWAIAKAVTGSGRHIFYDGRGVLVMRTIPKTSTYTFKTGPGGNVTSVPVVDYDVSTVRNLVTVKGAIPQGKKTPVAASVALPASHPLNSARLGRNGRHRVLYEVITDDNIKTAAQAKALAQSRVNSLALQDVDVSFDALVAPHLEPNDVYTLRTADFSINAYYRRATIPLKQGTGSVGVLLKRSTNKTRIRRR